MVFDGERGTSEMQMQIDADADARGARGREERRGAAGPKVGWKQKKEEEWDNGGAMT